MLPTQKPEDADVKSSRDSQSHFPVRDYSLALQSAVSWLGDRHLLATPIHALSRPHRWHGRPAAGRGGKSFQ